VGSGWKIKVFLEAVNFGGFNLIIVDLPKGLPMLGVSSSPNVIPVWNEHKSKNIETLFEFALAYLNDDGPLLLYFHKKKKC
jgi:hypothetical protein